ncbi:hypothetical protein XENTR_v10015890, partial [Xenopus tropicalis]
AQPQKTGRETHTTKWRTAAPSRDPFVPSRPLNSSQVSPADTPGTYIPTGRSALASRATPEDGMTGGEGCLYSGSSYSPETTSY